MVDGMPREALPGIGKGWYADIPLAPEGETVIEGSFEGGAIHSRQKLAWVSVNPFQVPENLKVRVGDSMKFSVSESGKADKSEEFHLTVDGSVAFAGGTSEEVVVTFARAGDHVVEARVSGESGEQVRTLVVTGVTADFGPQFHVAAGEGREWRVPGVAADLTLETDEYLELSGTSALSPEGLRTRVLWTGGGAGQPVVLARMGEAGPVVAATRINAFRLVDAAENGDARVVEVLGDGTRVVEIAYLIEGVTPPDFSLWIDFYVTDAVFADGSTRYHLTAADFDASGSARVRIYKAPGDGEAFVCHWNRLYEEDGQTETEADGEGGE